jgi:hypothetical protein
VQENINGFEKTLLSLIDEEDEQTVITESFTFKAKKIIRSINSNPIKNLQYIFEKNAGNKVSLPLDEVGQTKVNLGISAINYSLNPFIGY